MRNKSLLFGRASPGMPDEAAESLATRTDGQKRDRSIARRRHSRTLADVGDYAAALSQVEERRDNRGGGD